MGWVVVLADYGPGVLAHRKILNNKGLLSTGIGRFIHRLTFVRWIACKRQGVAKNCNPGLEKGPLFKKDRLTGLTGQPLSYRRYDASQFRVSLYEQFHLLLGVKDRRMVSTT